MLQLYLKRDHPLPHPASASVTRMADLCGGGDADVMCSPTQVTVAPRTGWKFVRKVDPAAPTHPGAPGLRLCRLTSFWEGHLGHRHPDTPSSAQMRAGLGRRDSPGAREWGHVPGPESLARVRPATALGAGFLSRVSQTRFFSLCPRQPGANFSSGPLGRGPSSASPPGRPTPTSRAPPPPPRAPAPYSRPPRPLLP